MASWTKILAYPIIYVQNNKQQTPDADTSPIETALDHLVYKLYDLSDEEIAIVERSATAFEENAHPSAPVSPSSRKPTAAKAPVSEDEVLE